MAPLPEQLQQLLEQFRRVADLNDWHQFHSPKNLSMAIAVEAAELMEVLQWHHGDQVISAEEKQKIADEMADIFLYLLCLADKVDVNLVDAAQSKMQKKLSQVSKSQ